MTRFVIGFGALLAVLPLHADALKDASNWPDLVRSAKQRGIDYPATVEGARRGDTAALTVLFRHTPHTDGSGADSHSVVLRQLLEMLGDRRFSNTLRHEPASLRSKVTKALDFDFGHSWQKKFPVTYALGSHDTSLLKPHNEKALDRAQQRSQTGAKLCLTARQLLTALWQEDYQGEIRK